MSSKSKRFMLNGYMYLICQKENLIWALSLTAVAILIVSN